MLAVAESCRGGDASRVRRLRIALATRGEEAELAWLVASALRKECEDMIEKTKKKKGVEAAAPEADYEAEFPVLAPKRRIRTTAVLLPSRAGGAANVFAAANAAPEEKRNDDDLFSRPIRLEKKVTTPKKRPRGLSLSTTKKKKEASSEDCALELGALFAAAVAKGGRSDLALGTALTTLCSLIGLNDDDDDDDDEIDEKLFLKGLRSGRRFACVAAAMLRKFVVALGGRAAAEGLAVGCNNDDALCVAARLAFEDAAKQAPRPMKRPGGVSKNIATSTDVSLPFVKQRDSRKVFEGDRRDRDAYNNRERARDTFLQLLRDFSKAQADVDGRALLKLVPVDDHAYFHGWRPLLETTGGGGGHLGQQQPQRQQAKQRPDGSSNDLTTLRGRASRLLRSLLPENVAWFAELFDATMVRAASASFFPSEDSSSKISADDDKLRKLEARIYESPQLASDDPASLFEHRETFFYLLVAAADAARLEAKLLGALAKGLEADLSSLENRADASEVLGRVCLRAKLAGVLLCLSSFGPDQALHEDLQADRPWPRALCPLCLLDSTGWGDFSSPVVSAKILLVSYLCRALRWDRAFFRAHRGSYVSRVKDALLSANYQIANATNDKKTLLSPALVCARLELERLVYDDLGLVTSHEKTNEETLKKNATRAAFDDEAPTVVLLPKEEDDDKEDLVWTFFPSATTTQKKAPLTPSAASNTPSAWTPSCAANKTTKALSLGPSTTSKRRLREDSPMVAVDDLGFAARSRAARHVARSCTALGAARGRRFLRLAPASALKSKLRPFLVRPTSSPEEKKDVDDEDARQRRLFAPVAASFFRRYPTMQAAVDLAVDASRLHFDHALETFDGDDLEAADLGKSLLLSRLKAALDLAAPPDDGRSSRVIAVATNLAIAHWSTDVAPNLLLQRWPTKTTTKHDAASTTMPLFHQDQPPPETT